jgi:hypothetical protein
MKLVVGAPFSAAVTLSKAELQTQLIRKGSVEWYQQKSYRWGHQDTDFDRFFKEDTVEPYKITPGDGYEVGCQHCLQLLHVPISTCQMHSKPSLLRPFLRAWPCMCAHSLVQMLHVVSIATRLFICVG